MQTEDHDGHAQPLKGLVLCSTSLSQDVRQALADLSHATGATHRLDLTADVTHLVVGAINTPKYKHVAKDRPDVYVLKPEWINAMRYAYTSADEIDVSALVDAFRLPTFYGLRICITGFDDLDQRDDIIAKIGAHGADYHGDLTKVVTHLIAKKPEGQKYERARTWDMKTVSLKWFEESMERGMTLEESLYDPLRPSEMQGQGAFVREYRRETALGKRSRQTRENVAAEESGKRKLRRVTSQRLNNHSQNLWADLSAVDTTNVLKTEDEWNDTSHVAGGIPLLPLDGAISRRSTPTMSGNDLSRPASRTAGPVVDFKPALFANCLFLVLGHPRQRTSKIVQVLQNEDGQVAETPDDLFSAVESQSHALTVLVLPSEWTANSSEPLPDVPADTWLVTELWIERCIVRKQLVVPEKDIYSQPRLNLPENCFKGMTISTTGLGNDAKIVQKLVEIAGGRYEEHLKPGCSVLIARNPGLTKVKVEYAVKHNVPVVYEQWLQVSVAGGSRFSMKPYHIPAFNPTTRQDKDNARPSEATKRKDDSLAQRLSATRKSSVTPALKVVRSRPLLAQSERKDIPKTSTAVLAASMPFLEEDLSPSEDEPAFVTGAQLDGARSQPLHELQPTVTNSPEKRPSERSSAAPQLAEQSVEETVVMHGDDYENVMLITEDASVAAHDEVGTTAHESVGGTMAQDQDKLRLSEDIKALLNRRKEASAASDLPRQGRRGRKDRKLGRASSNVSNPSAPISLAHSKSIEIADSTASASPLDPAAPLPSQQLGYDTIGAQEHRAWMTRRTGTNFETDGMGVRVGKIGVVKDVDAETSGASGGVGARVRGRHRHAKS